MLRRPRYAYLPQRPSLPYRAHSSTTALRQSGSAAMFAGGTRISPPGWQPRPEHPGWATGTMELLPPGMCAGTSSERRSAATPSVEDPQNARCASTHELSRIWWAARTNIGSRWRHTRPVSHQVATTLAVTNPVAVGYKNKPPEHARSEAGMASRHPGSCRSASPENSTRSPHPDLRSALPRHSQGVGWTTYGCLGVRSTIELGHDLYRLHPRSFDPLGSCSCHVALASGHPVHRIHGSGCGERLVPHDLSEPNGPGTSTLLQIVLRLSQPHGGILPPAARYPAFRRDLDWHDTTMFALTYHRYMLYQGQTS